MSIRKPLLCLGVLIVCGTAFSQPVPPGPMSPGEALRAEGDIPGAIAAFEKGYAANPGDRKNILNLAGALSINRRLDDCFKYLALAVEMEPTLEPLTDPDLVTAREDKRWAKFEDDLVAKLNSKPGRPYKDVAYAKALWKLAAWDQAFFQEVGIAARKTGLKSSVVEAVWKLKLLISKRNQADLEALLADRKWPRVAQVGQDAAMGAYLVVMHSEDGLQKKYLPAIKTICEAGELPWVRYANMFDRSRFNDNVPQRYGTHTRYNEQTKTAELYPLEDESRVDEWRKEIGLPPLAESLKAQGIAYTPQKK
jgi:hypothetical protein